MAMDRSSGSRLVAAAGEFGPLYARSWFTAAHQGPLPHAAVEATKRAAALKAAHHRIGDDDFIDVPERLRGLLAKLVGGAPEQIVLGNSTSYGLHLIANGLAWTDGDEVLTVDGDYPATVLPWQRLANAGVQVRSLRPAEGSLANCRASASSSDTRRASSSSACPSGSGSLPCSSTPFSPRVRTTRPGTPTTEI